MSTRSLISRITTAFPAILN